MRDPEPPVAEELTREILELRDWGYEWVVLHRDRCRGVVQAIQLGDELLGEGLRLDNGDVAWSLDSDGPESAR